MLRRLRWVLSRLYEFVDADTSGVRKIVMTNHGEVLQLLAQIVPHENFSEPLQCSVPYNCSPATSTSTLHGNLRYLLRPLLYVL